MAIPGITATGTTLATAYVLSLRGDMMTFDVQTTPSGSGVLLPQPAQCPTLVVIRNSGANALKVYPVSGGTLNGSTSAASLAAAGVLQLISLSSADWISL